MAILNSIKKIIPTKIFKAFQPAYHYFFAWLSSFVYRKPSDQLIVIGVTGTTGKTTSVYLIAKMLEGLGYKVGYTSTAMFNDGKREWLNDKKMTMIGRFFTQKILRQMVKNGCRYAIVETTSEGVRQFRHKFINYDLLVFTGLYPEHIESHGNFENYKKAKGDLFKHLKKCKTKYTDENKNVQKNISDIKKIDFNRVKKTIIANFDDEYADYFLNFWAEEKIAYSENKEGETNGIKVIKYDNVHVNNKGTSFNTLNEEIKLKLLGIFNSTNSMNAICIGVNQKFQINEIKQSLKKIKGVPGRLEMVDEGQNFIVIVDYAFEPNAVKKLYETIDLIPHNKIIHVLGSCGGGRDASRRPILGRIAGEKADYVVITNEDPYDEDPQIIIDQVGYGVEKNTAMKKNENFFKIMNRGEGIKKGIALAKKGDVVLITGKGSEQAICVANGKKIKWDDRNEARKILKKI